MRLYRTILIASSLFLGVHALAPETSADAPEWRDSGSGFIYRTAAANGISVAVLDYRGSTAAPADTVGDQIEFQIISPPGAKFTTGSATRVVALGGAACTAQPDPAEDSDDLSRCFATASIVSTTAGTVTVQMRNVSSGGGILQGQTQFLEPRAIVSMFDTRGSPDTESNAIDIQNAGTASASIVLSFVSRNGVEVESMRQLELAPGAIAHYEEDANGELPDFSGTVTVASDQPLAVTAYHGIIDQSGKVRRSQQRALPFQRSTGGNAVALPYVANQLEGAYNTLFAVTNTGVTPVCFTLRYNFVAGAGSVGPGGKPPITHSADASAACPDGGLAVPPGRELIFTPRPVGEVTMPGVTINTLMAVLVEATGGTVGVSVRAYTSDSTSKEAAYEGFDTAEDVGTEIVVPLALKTADGYYTHILFSNPFDETADVEVTYTGNTGTHTASQTLGPFGVGNHSTYSDNVVPSGFVGAAVVKSSSPIAVVVFRAKKVNPAGELDEDLYTSLNGVPIGLAAKETWFPAIARRIGRVAGFDGVNSWISVSVPNGGAANLTLRAVGSCEGPDQVYTSTKTIQGSHIFYLNSETDTGLGPNPPGCFSGAVQISSDVPVVGTASYINDAGPGDGEAVYNGIVLP